MNSANEYYDNQYHVRRHKHLLEDDEYFWARAETAMRLYFTNEEMTKRIFEYGCGIGQGIATLPSAWGWDISAEARAACRSRNLKIYDSLTEVPKESFDIVFCRHVLEHVEDPLQTLRTMRELVTPDGELFLILPRENHFQCALEADLDQHLYCWNFRAANNLLRRAGFLPVRNYCTYILGYRVLLPIRRLFGKNAYFYLTRLVGWAKRNGELVIRARKASNRS